MIDKETKLSKRETRNFKIFKKQVEYWIEHLLIDPAWYFHIEVVEDEDDDGLRNAFLDIGTSEYFEATLGISRKLLQLTFENKQMAENFYSFFACHEILHAMTADYHRSALNACDENDPLINELIYRYEQVVSKLTSILIGFKDASNL